MKMQGYEHYSNIGANCRRGVILYIREDLNAMAIKLEKEAEFEESTWCEVKLKG